MTSKCGKNKKSGTQGVAECVTDEVTDVLYNNEKPFLFQNIST